MLHVTFTRVMGGYIKATLMQCAIIGIGCGILFAVAGIPNYAALGVIAGLLNIIPVVGPWLGGALAAIVGLFVQPGGRRRGACGHHRHPTGRLHIRLAQDHGGLGGRASGAHPHHVAGGLRHRRRHERVRRIDFRHVVAIPAVAVAKAVFVYYFEKRTGRQLVAEDGVFFKGTPSEGDQVDPLGGRHRASSRLDGGDAAHPGDQGAGRKPRQPAPPALDDTAHIALQLPGCGDRAVS